MATVAELTIRAEEFALAETFDRCADAEFEVVRSAATLSNGLESLLWASGADSADLDGAFADDPSVDSATMLDEASERRLYRVAWSAPVRVVLSMLLDDGVATEVVGVSNRWHFEVIFPDRDALSTAYRLSDEYGVDFEVGNIYALADDHYRTFDLTQKQRYTLAVAHELGYFKIPREVSLDELASRIGISRQAISERLRRAHDALIRNTVRSRDMSEESLK